MSHLPAMLRSPLLSMPFLSQRGMQERPRDADGVVPGSCPVYTLSHRLDDADSRVYVGVTCDKGSDADDEEEI
jgi:hypothetical protein